MSHETQWDSPEEINSDIPDDVKKFYADMQKKMDTEYSEAEKSLLKERIQVLNEKFLEGELICPDKIYLDLGLIKDINLGVLFAMIFSRPTAQKDYTYITSNLKAYQIRTFDDPLKYFPELNISQEDFDAFLSNEANHKLIYTLAPFTVYHYVLRDNLKKNSRHALMKQKYTDRPIPGKKDFVRDYNDITFFVNTYPLKLTNFHKASLQKLLGDSLGIGVMILETSIETLPINAMLAIEEFNVYSLPKFLDNQGINKALGEEKFIGKYVYAPLLFERESLEVINQNDDPDKFFHTEKSKLEAVMSLCCFFNWLEAARYCVDLSVFEVEGDTEDKDEELPIL